MRSSKLIGYWNFHHFKNAFKLSAPLVMANTSHNRLVIYDYKNEIIFTIEFSICWDEWKVAICHFAIKWFDSVWISTKIIWLVGCLNGRRFVFHFCPLHATFQLASETVYFILRWSYFWQFAFSHKITNTNIALNMWMRIEAIENRPNRKLSTYTEDKKKPTHTETKQFALFVVVVVFDRFF